MWRCRPAHRTDRPAAGGGGGAPLRRPARPHRHRVQIPWHHLPLHHRGGRRVPPPTWHACHMAARWLALSNTRARCAELGVEAALVHLRLFSMMMDSVLSHGAEVWRVQLVARAAASREAADGLPARTAGGVAGGTQLGCNAVVLSELPRQGRRRCGGAGCGPAPSSGARQRARAQPPTASCPKRSPPPPIWPPPTPPSPPPGSPGLASWPPRWQQSASPSTWPPPRPSPLWPPPADELCQRQQFQAKQALRRPRWALGHQIPAFTKGTPAAAP